jgi:hypothetical protein
MRNEAGLSPTRTGGFKSVISVTKALSIISQDYGPEGAVEKAASRGQTVHQACAAYALGLYPILSEETEGYFVSFKNWWKKMVDCLVIDPETEVKDEALGVVGHPDIIVILKNGEVVLVDLKTPIAFKDMWKVQISTYRHLVKVDKNIIVDRCGALRLNSDGRPAKIDWIEKPDFWFSIFLQALNLHRIFGKEEKSCQ